MCSKPIVNDRLEATCYDRLSASLYLGNHLHTGLASRLSGLKPFHYDLDFSHGGPCIPLTLDLLARLPPEIKGYVVAAQIA